MTRLLAAALLATVCAVPASAQEVVLDGTLRAVLDRGAFRVGVRVDAVPFSFRNRGGQPIGFSVDVCHAIAEAAASALNRDLVEPGQTGTGIQLVYVPVAANERMSKLVAGDIDLECSSTTANTDRARTAAFSPVFFLAGTRLLVPRGSGVEGYLGLAGRTVTVSAGTTNADVLQRLAARMSPPMVVREVSSLVAVYDGVASGNAQAGASDDVLLAGMIATRSDGARFQLVGEFLSYVPYAIMFRRADPAMAGLVARTFGELAQSGRLSALYNRWFMSALPNGSVLNLPMSAQLLEMYRALGQPD